MRFKVDEILERAHVVALPMAVRFRGIEVREALLIDGPAGWGEFSPFVEYGDVEAAAWLRAGLEGAFIGYDDLALGDGLVEVNGTVPAVPAAQVPEVLARFAGIRTFKIKVGEPGQTLADDVARVRAVHDHAPGAALRVDANRAWTVPEAIQAARAFAAVAPLEYIEQPCATVEELAQVRGSVDTPIAADESIRKAADPYRVAELGAADVAVAKVAPLGGVRPTIRIGADLGARGLGLTVASALDTAVGLRAGLIAAKAAALAAPPTGRSAGRVSGNAAGLATQRLFREDVAEPIEIVDGCISIDAVADPDPDRLAALRAPAERQDWWRARLSRCLKVLETR